MKTVEEEVGRARGQRPAAEAFVPFGLGVLLTLAASLALRQVSGLAVAPIHEGAISSVSWTEGENRGAFLTRSSDPIAVPGGNGSGSTSVKMRGRLFPSHLEIWFQGRGDGRMQVIPLQRVVSLVFDDGEGKSSP